MNCTSGLDDFYLVHVVEAVIGFKSKFVWSTGSCWHWNGSGMIWWLSVGKEGVPFIFFIVVGDVDWAQFSLAEWVEWIVGVQLEVNLHFVLNLVCQLVTGAVVLLLLIYDDLFMCCMCVSCMYVACVLVWVAMNVWSLFKSENAGFWFFGLFLFFGGVFLCVADRCPKFENWSVQTRPIGPKFFFT